MAQPSPPHTRAGELGSQGRRPVPGTDNPTLVLCVFLCVLVWWPAYCAHKSILALHTHAHMHTCTHIHMHTCTHTHTLSLSLMCVCVCVCFGRERPVLEVSMNELASTPFHSSPPRASLNIGTRSLEALRTLRPFTTPIPLSQFVFFFF